MLFVDALIHLRRLKARWEGPNFIPFVNLFAVDVESNRFLDRSPRVVWSVGIVRDFDAVHPGTGRIPRELSRPLFIDGERTDFCSVDRGKPKFLVGSIHGVYR